MPGQTEGRKDGWKDGQILFYRTLPATFGGPIKSIGKHKTACSIFLDFEKAFDSVNHDILLSKFEYYSVRGIPLKWFILMYKDKLKHLRLLIYIMCSTPKKCSWPITFPYLYK